MSGEGSGRIIDRRAGDAMPKVTKAEGLLYSDDLAPIVRLAGEALTKLHDAMVWLAEASNDSFPDQPESSTTRAVVNRWKLAFGALAPSHDALIDGYREVARIGMEAGQAEMFTADADAYELVRPFEEEEPYAGVVRPVEEGKTYSVGASRQR